MMTSHGTIQGYKGQALVDTKHRVIVYGKAFGDGQDHSYVPPLLDGAKETVQAIGRSEDCLKEKILVPDSNCHSPTNLKKCEDERLDASIPDKRFRRRDPRFATQQRWRPHWGKRFTGEDFHHDESTDAYVCSQGKTLKRTVKQFIKDGIVYRRYVADAQDCRRCQFRGRCLRGTQANRRHLNVPIGHLSGNLTKEMAEKIDTHSRDAASIINGWLLQSPCLPISGT